MSKERNKADAYRERLRVGERSSGMKAYEGDTRAMNRSAEGRLFPKGLKKATFQGYQPAIDYCKEHGLKWY